MIGTSNRQNVEHFVNSGILHRRTVLKTHQMQRGSSLATRCINQGNPLNYFQVEQSVSGRGAI